MASPTRRATGFRLLDDQEHQCQQFAQIESLHSIGMAMCNLLKENANGGTWTIPTSWDPCNPKHEILICSLEVNENAQVPQIWPHCLRVLLKMSSWEKDILWFMVIGECQVRSASWSLMSYLVCCAECDVSCTLMMVYISWYDMRQMMSCVMRYTLRVDILPSCWSWIEVESPGRRGETAFSGRRGWLLLLAPATSLLRLCHELKAPARAKAAPPPNLLSPPLPPPSWHTSPLTHTYTQPNFCNTSSQLCAPCPKALSSK